MRTIVVILALAAAVACGGGGSTGTPSPSGDSGAGSDGASDVGAPDDAGDSCASVLPGPAFSVGQPLDAASLGDAGAGGWHWVDFPDSACANGTPTGIGVSAGPAGARKLLLYLEGGGACYDATTCFTTPTAAHTNGYGRTEFNTDIVARAAAGIFDRADATNPYKDFHHVFVPYCTGDVHRGNNVATYGAHHVGYQNLDAFLKRLVPTLQGKLDQVVLHGSSAGGFGTTWNVWHVQNAFWPVPVVYVDDCGPDAVADGAHLYGSAGVWNDATHEWRADLTAPPRLVECGGTDNAHLVTYLGRAMPSVRGALIESLQDSVIATVLGRTGPATEAILRGFAANVAPTNPHFRYWFIPGTRHVWSFTSLGASTSGGVTLSAFIQAELADDPAWASVLP